MAVNAGTVYSSIRIRLTQLDQDLKGVYSRLDALEQKIVTTSKAPEKITQSFNFMSLAAIGAFAAIGNAIKTAIGQFATFEQSIANVQSVAGGSAEDMNNLADAARAAGESTRFTATQAADALYFLASAGLDATQSIDALDGVLLLAGATGSDLAQTSATMTAALSQFSLEADQASRVSNVFAAAITGSQANMEKLTNAMRQVGPVAGALGHSIEETTGALEVLFNAGFKGEQAGTILRNALSDLANETGPVIGRLEELGVSFEQVNPTTNSLSDAIRAMQKAGIDATQAISIFGKEAGPGLATLLTAGGDKIDEMTASITGTSAASTAYAIQNDTLQGSLDKLASAAESLGITVGENLNPIIRGAVDLLTNIIKVVNSIPGPLLSAGAAAATAAIGVNGIAAALTAMGVSINVALGPIALVTAGIAGFIGLVSGLTAEIEKQEKLRYSEQFTDLAKELGVSGEKIEEFNKRAGQFSDVFKQITEFNTIEDTETLLSIVKDLAQQYGITGDRVIQILDNTEGLTDESKRQLEILKQHIDEQVTLNNLQSGSAEINELIAGYQNYHLESLRKIQEEQRRQSELEERQAQVELTRNGLIKQIGFLIDQNNRGTITDLELQQEALKLRQQARDELLKLGQEAGGLSSSEQTFLSTLNGLIEGNQKSIDNLNESSKEELDLANQKLSIEEKYRDLVNEQTLSRLELLENERKKAIQEADKTGADTTDITAYYEAEKTKIIEEENEKRIEQDRKYINFALDSYQDLASALQDLFSVLADRRIAEIDRELQAELEASGLAEETEIQRLQRQLQEAIDTGDTATAVELQQEIERQNIRDKYAREKAQVEYEVALASWGIQLTLAIAQAAQSTLNAYASTAAIPIIGPGLAPIAAAIAATAGALQVAAVGASKPQPPSFQTGGIVPGQSFSGDNVLVRANSGEMILNEQQQRQLFDIAQGNQRNRGSGVAILEIYVISEDQRAKRVVELINNGKYKLNI